MDRLHAKDKELDDMLNEVIGVNAEVRKQLQYGNEIIDQQGDMIRKNTKKVDLVDQMVVKADNDLAEVLKSVHLKGLSIEGRASCASTSLSSSWYQLLSVLLSIWSRIRDVILIFYSKILSFFGCLVVTDVR